MSSFKYLAHSSKNTRGGKFVYLLATCFVLLHTAAFAIEDHADEKKLAPRPKPGKQNSNREQVCSVDPSELAEFANGEAYHFESLNSYLVDPACQGNQRTLQTLALPNVRFSQVAPFRLDNFAASLGAKALENTRRTETALKNFIPGILRQDLLSGDAMLPILGQVSLLSPAAGRLVLSDVIRKELISADARLATAGPEKTSLSLGVAENLVKLGLDNSEIASDFAANVEDHALLAQADSLAKMFRSLGAAASSEEKLVQAFNLSAAGLNRGVQRGLAFYSEDQKEGLMKASYEAAKSTLGSGTDLAPGSAEINEALSSLIQDKSLKATALAARWKEVMRFLAAASGQEGLAEAVSKSITPEFLFLPERDASSLVSAAKNYPSIASRLQKSFLVGWDSSWKNVTNGTLGLAQWREYKTKYFVPLTNRLLELEPGFIETEWLKAIVHFKLIDDIGIEKRFPKLVLHILNERQAELKAKADAPSAVLGSMGRDLQMLWSMSQVHFPTLMDWVKRQE